MSATPALPADEFPAAGLFADSVAALSARDGLDQLLVAALTAPGLAEVEVGRLVDYAGGEQLRRGRAALGRISRRLGEEEAW